MLRLRRSSRPGPGLAGIFLLLLRALAGGEEVAVVYSRQIPESKELALHYAAERGVRSSQLIELDLPAGETLSRTAYRETLEQPLLAELQKRGLMTLGPVPGGPAPGPEGAPRNRCTQSRIRYLLLTYGLPYRISQDGPLPAQANPARPAFADGNNAAVDSELMLLPCLGTYPLNGPVPNPWFSKTNLAHLHPTNGVLLVSRLDGPSAALARGLVTKAREAEATGLCGHAYFDLRGITEGPYLPGELWLTNMARITRQAGYSTYLDTRPESFPATLPMSHVAIYGGWYESNLTGPFLRPGFEFMPGAIAYHLHSFNALQPRSPDVSWVGPLLGRGATVSLGTIDEPFLAGTVNPALLLAFLTQLHTTLGEAVVAALPVLSWQNLVIGDPLYRPFGKGILDLENELTARRDARLEWAILRKVNLYLEAGKDPDTLRQYLIEHPLTSQSAILSEKVALMFADQGRLNLALTWAGQALDLARSPDQRVRLQLNLAGWHDTTGQPAKAFQILAQVETNRPDYAALLSFRKKQLDLARQASLGAETTRLAEEVRRLSTPATNAPPPPP
ncbi:MAG: TIGR03790 family protein [Verrucomicrobiota bacterium]